MWYMQVDLYMSVIMHCLAHMFMLGAWSLALKNAWIEMLLWRVKVKPQFITVILLLCRWWPAGSRQMYPWNGNSIHVPESPFNEACSAKICFAIACVTSRKTHSTLLYERIWGNKPTLTLHFGGAMTFLIWIKNSGGYLVHVYMWRGVAKPSVTEWVW